MKDELDHIEKVRKKHEDVLLSLDGVVGVGIGLSAENKPCIKVSLTKLTPKRAKLIPKELERIRVEVEEVGEIIAY